MRYLTTVVLICILNSLVLTAFAQKSNLKSAHNYMRHEEYDNAKEAIDKATEHEETRHEPKTWFYRGKIYLAIATSEEYAALAEEPILEAMEAFQRTLELDEEEVYKPEVQQSINITASALYSKGVEAYNEDDFEMAYIRFAKAREVMPEDTALLLSTAFAADRAEKKEQAKALYKELVGLRVDNPGVYRSLIFAYMNDNAVDSAMKYAGIARKVFPDNQDIIIDELNLYLRTGQMEAFIPKAEKAIEVSPDNAILHFALGSAYENKANKMETEEEKEKYLNKATEAYEKSVALDEGYFDPIYNLGALYYNKATEIIAAMNQLSLDEDEEYERLKRLRNRYFSKSLPHLERAHELEPEDRNTMEALREVYSRLDNEKKAEQMNEKLKGTTN